MELLLFALLGWFIGIIVNRVSENFTCQRPFFATPVCQNCSTARSWLQQSGLLRLLFRRSLCSSCGTPVPSIAPVVEIAGVAAYSTLWLTFGPTVGLALSAVYTAIFLVVFVIDLNHRLIPDRIMLPAVLIAVLASPISPAGLNRSLLGGAIAFVIVLGIYFFGKLFEFLRGYHIRGGVFGQGDVKLASFMGLVTAFPGTFSAIVLTIFLGGLGALLYVAYYAVARRGSALGVAIPYGPYFCIAGWIVMVLRW